MQRPFVTIILAGGKGTRMGSSDRHKVCFEVLGVPVILRALETYNLCGSIANIVVVGMLAEAVMATVNRRFPGTIYAFQEEARGTGDAARKGAELLERMRFDGDILVVAGDKLIEPHVIRRLVTSHQRGGADVTLLTGQRPAQSSTGILLTSPRGNIVGILEEAERQRLVGLAALARAFRHRQACSQAEARQILASHLAEKHLPKLIAELWRGRDISRPLSRSGYEEQVPIEARSGRLKVAGLSIPADQILKRCTQMNLATYIFRAPVLYEALDRLKSARAGQEEYLTDVFEILARGRNPVRVVGCRVDDLRDVMAFNNPQELLAVEEVCRQKQGQTVEAGPAHAGTALASVATWDNLLRQPSLAAQRQFRRWYGEEVPWTAIREVLQHFARRYGADRPVAVLRSPGRVNLLGRHIDHQGGHVNVMAVNREIFLVAAPREDDQVNLANTNATLFAEQTFRISNLVANLDWDDWQHVIDSPRLHRLLEAARGDWSNYIQAAILRLQEQFRDRRLHGLDLMVGGDIPMGAGLSSSSALVVAAAAAVTAFNRLPVSGRRLVSLCGEGEWFVGTRGGAADHAAIKLSRRGYVTRVGFFPFRIEDAAPFFPDHALIICNSGIFAGKSAKARQLFNEKVAAYHVGRFWCKMLRPDLAHKIEHLRDVTSEHLGLSRAEFFRFLAQLPLRISRAQVQTALAQAPPADRQRLERLFLSHDAPAQGYPVRDVVLFGLSEMARARRCLDLLKRNQARTLGRLMNISHDGDRVSRESKGQQWRRASMSVPASRLEALATQRSRDADLASLPGAYGCSLPEIDRIVDLSLRLPGVEGAQLAGAGLGGCVMVLVQKDHARQACRALVERGFEADIFRPIAGAGSLSLA